MPTPSRPRDCVVLTKLDPFADWTPYTWNLQVGKGFRVNKDSIELVPDELLPPQPKEGEQASEVIQPEVVAPPGTKVCSICTFINEMYLTMCEMCGTPLG